MKLFILFFNDIDFIHFSLIEDSDEIQVENDDFSYLLLNKIFQVRLLIQKGSLSFLIDYYTLLIYNSLETLNIQ